MTACSPFQCLEISDGTTTVNLLSAKSGFCLRSWSPAVSEPKGGGVWKDSQLAAGRQLAMRELGNVADAFVLDVRNWTPDDLIRDTQNLRRLLEKACAYRTSKWQDEEVWVKRQGVYEAYPTYTLVEDYRTPQDGNPHGSAHFWTAMGNSAFPEFKLVVEHEPWWRGDVPGTGTCVQASGQQENWAYTDWAQSTALPVGSGMDLIETAGGWLLSSDLGPPGEVWRSPNGIAWAASATPPPTGPYSMYEHTDGFLYALCGFAGIYRSGDNGNNWVLRNAGPPPWVTLSHTLIGIGNWLFASDQSVFGVYRSNDGGLIWNLSLNGYTEGIGKDNDDNLYVGTNGFAETAAIHRSTDLGVTWDATPPYQPGNLDHIYFIKQVGDDLVASVQFSVGGYGLLRSQDGLNWGVVLDNMTYMIYDIVLASDGYYYITLYRAAVASYIYRGSYLTDWKLVATTNPGARALIEYSANEVLYATLTGEILSGPMTTDVGASSSCSDSVYVANKENIAQLTSVYVYDAAPVTWTSQFPAAAFPFNLLNAAPAAGDMTYFGIDSTLIDSGPFSNLVFDITRPFFFTIAGYTYVWEYYQGAWLALNVEDGTVGFSIDGVNSVHWVPPSDWIPANLFTLFGGGAPNITAYWVRLRTTAIPAYVDAPQQGNRDVYTCNWPRVDVDDAQVLGDIPALMQFKFHNRSDEDGYETTIDELDLLENRVICGLRSMSRGADFIAYLNCADEQNPIGVTVAVGTNSAFGNDITAPTGRVVVHTTDGASTWADECIFTLSPSIAQDFYGSFHAYARAQEVDWDAAIDEVRVRLQVRTGSGGVTFTTEHKPFRNLNDWQLLDFQGLSVPASGLLSSADLGDETEIAIQVWSSASALTVNLYDLVLIPTDEWALDAVDKAMKDDSGVTNGYLLDVDSVTYPKRDIRALVRVADDVGLIRSVYQPNTPGHAILQANADQRLWFLTARGMVDGSHTGGNNVLTLTDASASFLTSGVQTGQVIFNVTDGSAGFVGATVTATTITDCGLAGGTDNDWDTNDEYLIVCPNWCSEPWNCHSVQVWNNARYLSMRGAR